MSEKITCPFCGNIGELQSFQDEAIIEAHHLLPDDPDVVWPSCEGFCEGVDGNCGMVFHLDHARLAVKHARLVALWHGLKKALEDR